MSSPADWPVSAEGTGTPEAALQLALDLTSLDRAAELVAKLSPTLARIEIGTPLAIASGLAAIDRIRPLSRPGAVIVADVKICDAGEKIARSAYAAGADVVTVVAPAIDRSPGAAFSPRLRIRAAAAAIRRQSWSTRSEPGPIPRRWGGWPPGGGGQAHPGPGAAGAGGRVRHADRGRRGDRRR